MLPYKIVRVGIPIKQEHISNEFLKVLDEIQNDPAVIGLVTTSHHPSSQEYKNAPAGNKLLPIDKLADYSFIWGTSKTRDLNVIVKNLLDHLDSQHNILKFKKVYMFASGSPMCSDSLTLLIGKSRPIDVIDTLSSVDLAILEFRNVIGSCAIDIRNYHYDFILKDNRYVDPNTLNIWTCLQKGYEVNGKSILEMFLSDMESIIGSDAMFLAVNIGEDNNIVFKETIATARQNVSMFYNYPKSLVFGTYNGILR